MSDDEEQEDWLWPVRVTIENVLGEPKTLHVEVQKPALLHLVYEASRAWHRGKREYADAPVEEDETDG